MFAGKKSAQIREILINESAWEEMTCLFAPSLGDISYSLYLSHAIVMLFLINFKDFIPLYEKPGFSKFSFIIALSLFLSFFIYKYIETPFINIGKTISKRLSKPTLTYSE